MDVHFPAAPRITLVMDNLNTHVLASLYKAFAPAESRRIWERLEVHDTPQHGSWRNMAEIELRVLARQCLDRRIPDQDTLRQEWQPGKPNAMHAASLPIGVSRPPMHASRGVP